MSATLKKLLAPVLSLFGRKKKQTEFHMPQGLSREQQKQLREIRERNTRDPNILQTGVRAKTLSGKERLYLMHSMFHMGEGDNEKFLFDWKWLEGSGLSVKDFMPRPALPF